MPTLPKTIYRDAGKPNGAVPVTTERAEPGAFTSGSEADQLRSLPTMEARAAQRSTDRSVAVVPPLSEAKAPNDGYRVVVRQLRCKRKV
jgi:hypothetical protein